MTIDQVLEFQVIETATTKTFDEVKIQALSFAQEICGEKAASVLPVLEKLSSGESLARSLRVLVKAILPRQFHIALSDDTVVAAYTKAFNL
jgi:hypothetical protein